MEKCEHQWRDIETAPKTGDDDVLLCFADGDIEMAFWRVDANAWDSADGWVLIPPTHWMPLPAPPKEGEPLSEIRFSGNA